LLWYQTKLISSVKEITPEIEKLASGASLGGRGGMVTKLQGAKVVTKSGAYAIIVNGLIPGIIKQTFETENAQGTTFLPTEALSSRKRWIAYATNVKGKIYINEGAKSALIERKTSLLPVGITKVSGNFTHNDVVSICDDRNQEIARGIVNYDTSEVKKIMGIHSDKIEQILGHKISNDVIGKDNLVLL
jgi:glutamate 5-kinase